MKPLVSILIPAFNAQEWIADTLRSALSQTWEPKEIIVVDDGSTDQTLAVARRFQSDNLRVVTQKNQGAAAARNTAFSLSKGEYVQWLDADDFLAPDKIARQMDALGHDPDTRLLLSSAWAYFLYRPDRAKFVPTALWQDLTPAEWLLCKMEKNLHMQTATWLVCRAMTEAAGPWDTTLNADDDGEYFCRVLLNSDRVRFVREAKVYYRASGSSSLSYIGCFNRKLESQWRSMQLHIRYLRSLDDNPRARAACVKYLQIWLHNFYPERLDIVKQAHRLAREMGGQLYTPRLSWKYAWLELLFGGSSAKRAQIFARNLKWSLIRSYERNLHRLQKRWG